jgi:predicted RNase H-like HicB family nuclease
MSDVMFIYEGDDENEDDGRVTARHIESDVASFGDSEAEALRELADALESHFDTAGSTDA